MVLRGKKGAEDLIPENFVRLFVSVGFFLICVGLIALGIYFLVGSNSECENKRAWDPVEAALKRMDSGEKDTTVQFYNSECKLVGFPPKNGVYSTFATSSEVFSSPQVCLCQIVKGKCKPVSCYKLSKFDALSWPTQESQVSTVNSRSDLIFLKFEEKDATLVVSVIGQTRQEQTATYRKDNPKAKQVDPSGLINSLEVKYSDPTPPKLVSITVKEHATFYPSEMARVGQILPLFFDINLDFPQAKQNVIKTMGLEVALTKEEKEALGEKQPLLFYEKGEEWLSTPLMCDSKDVTQQAVLDFPAQEVLTQTNQVSDRIIPCTAKINEFAEHFAISAGVTQ